METHGKQGCHVSMMIYEIMYGIAWKLHEFDTSQGNLTKTMFGLDKKSRLSIIQYLLVFSRILRFVITETFIELIS